MPRRIPFALLDHLLQAVGLKRLDMSLDRETGQPYAKQGRKATIYHDSKMEPVIILPRYRPKDAVRLHDVQGVGMMLHYSGFMDRDEYDDFIYAIHAERKRRSHGYVA